MYAFLLPFGTAPKEIGFVALVVWSIIRWRELLPDLRGLLSDRIAFALGAWAGWSALSVLWSSDVEMGIEQLRPLRYLLTGFILLPFARQPMWLIWAFIAGVHAQNLVQLQQWLGILGLEPGPDNRLGGTVGEITLGMICGAVMCWHVALALTRTGWMRWAAVAGFLVAGAGLVFSGSRGPWLATAAVIPAQLAWMAWRMPQTRRPAFVLVVVMAVSAVCSWPVTGDLVVHRVQRIVEDVQYMGDDAYGTDVGFRLASWEYGLKMSLRRPIHGYGSGSFREAHDIAWETSETIAAEHAHSVFVHVLYCTGLVGLGLLLWALLGSVRRALRTGDPMVTATGFAILTWMGGGMFDTFHVNGNTMGVLLLFITLVPRPEPAGADDES